jgi:diacylglycerol kinase (ATP)
VQPSKTLVIINPVSGTNSKRDFPALLKKYINPDKHDISVQFTKHAGHATDLTKDAIEQSYDNVIAVGGDGTINEIARILVNTSVCLGIIPSGSGNGLARHFEIPLKTIEAIKALNNCNVEIADSGSLNGHPFFCTAGIGFDAHIGQKFSEADTRGLSTYVKTTLKEFIKYQPEIYQISTPKEQIKEQAFLITFANTNQYGNNAFIAPKANTQDGLLDVCILKPFPFYKVPQIGIKLFGGSIHQSKYMKTFQSDVIEITRFQAAAAHVDGEPIELGQNLEIKCIPSSLKILVPTERRK